MEKSSNDQSQACVKIGISPVSILQTAAAILITMLVANLFKILFVPLLSASGTLCGTLLRPIFEDVEQPGWMVNTSPVVLDMSLACPRGIFLTWTEFFATLFCLALCLAVALKARKILDAVSQGNQG